MAKTTRAESAAAIVDDARAEAFAQYLVSKKRSAPGSVFLLSDPDVADVEVIPTGAIGLDVAIGAGGFPRGRVTELFGPESGGKTSLALHAVKNAQEMGGHAAFIDAEHSLNLELCEHIGVDITKMAIAQPDDGEEAINLVREMVETGAFDVIVVDSVAALVPRAEIERDTDESPGMGLHARLMSRFMRDVVGPLKKTNTALILINQIRKDLAAYGAPDTTTGGRAIKFYASLRLEVRTSPSKKIGPPDAPIGVTVTATVKKNKVGPPFRKTEYNLIFGHGVDTVSSLFDAAETVGALVKTGNTYVEAVTGERVEVGKPKTLERIAADPDLASRLTDAVYAAQAARRKDALSTAIAEGGDDTGGEPSAEKAAAQAITELYHTLQSA